MSDKRTKGKWEVAIEAKSDVIATEDIIVAELRGDRLGVTISRADAEFICTAVNAYDYLRSRNKDRADVITNLSREGDLLRMELLRSEAKATLVDELVEGLRKIELHEFDRFKAGIGYDSYVDTVAKAILKRVKEVKDAERNI